MCNRKRRAHNSELYRDRERLQLAAVAEHEREVISQRTKAALQAAKARGAILGSLDPMKGAAIRTQVFQEKADRFAANTLPIIRGLQAEGIASYKALARALNVRGIPTANNRKWYGTTVRNVLCRTIGVSIVSERKREIEK